MHKVMTHRRRARVITVAVILLDILLLAAVGLLIAERYLPRDGEETQLAEPAKVELPEEEPLPQAELSPEPEAPPEETLWQLLLVNGTHLLEEDYLPELTLLDGGQAVDSRIAEALQAMLSDMKKAGLSPVICSSYRSQARQKELFDKKVSSFTALGYTASAAEEEAGKWVARPGISEHQTGLAVDIVSLAYQLLDEQQEETAEQQWLLEHCWEYGFILRYPPEKSEITGIRYEPWHYRYVGIAAATEMQRSGLCLEEYLETIPD